MLIMGERRKGRQSLRDVGSVRVLVRGFVKALMTTLPSPHVMTSRDRPTINAPLEDRLRLVVYLVRRLAAPHHAVPKPTNHLGCLSNVPFD